MKLLFCKVLFINWILKWKKSKTHHLKINVWLHTKGNFLRIISYFIFVSSHLCRITFLFHLCFTCLNLTRHNLAQSFLKTNSATLIFLGNKNINTSQICVSSLHRSHADRSWILRLFRQTHFPAHRRKKGRPFVTHCRGRNLLFCRWGDYSHSKHYLASPALKGGLISFICVSFACQ